MQRAHRKAHAWIWTVMAVVLPICLALAFTSTSKLSSDAPSIKLAPADRPEDP